jgi:hypothetical protein
MRMLQPPEDPPTSEFDRPLIYSLREVGPVQHTTTVGAGVGVHMGAL